LLRAGEQELPHAVKDRSRLRKIIRRRHPLRRRFEQDERLAALRVRCREQRRGGTALRKPDDRCTLKADGVHDDPHVLQPLFERRRPGDRVR
jgi:hypothetical protein